MNGSASEKITAPLVGKRFASLKDMAKAVRMDEESFQTVLGIFLNNGIINIIHINAQGLEVFFSKQGPWLSSDEIAAEAEKTKSTVLRLSKIMPPWMVQKKGNRYQFRSPAVEFIKNYYSPRSDNQKYIIPTTLKFTPDASKVWDKIPSKDQNKILKNVWCGSCRKLVKIVNFSGTCRKNGGLTLKGSCAVCRGKVARLVEPLKDRKR